jgi:acetyl esterase/lipase
MFPLRRHRATVLAALALSLLLAGCGTTGVDVQVSADGGFALPAPESYPGIRVTEDVQYGVAGSEPLLLDVCEQPEGDPSTAGPRRAILVVHGGSWRAGDKAAPGWRSACEWLASEGFVAFSINYRLAPLFTFPAQILDVRAAVRWIRQPDHAARFDIDPDRIGALGGSAGGNLVALLAVEGDGDVTVGSRVSAVVDLSGPTDLTSDGSQRTGFESAFQVLIAQYLGCGTLAGCASAEKASPLFAVDDTDPPFLVVNSTTELVPLAQAEEFVTRLRASGVETDFVTVEGSLHSIALHDAELTARIASFLRAKLGVAAPAAAAATP